MKTMLPRYTWTCSAERAASALDAVCETRQGMMVLGNPGSGKTAFTYAVCNRASAIGRLARVQVAASGTARCLSDGLLDSLGWKPQGTARAGVNLLGQVLPLLGIGAVVVDDAHRLTAPGFDILRELQDLAAVGLVLCGPSRLWPLLGERCPELAHRITVIHELEPVDDTDMVQLVNEVPMLEGRSDLHDLARVLMAATGGNVGRLVQTLEEARYRSRRSHRPVTSRLMSRIHHDRQRLYHKLP